MRLVEGLGAGLEGARGVDDGVVVGLVLHDVEGALHVVAQFPQLADLAVHARQAEDHIGNLRCALLHVLGRILIEGERGGGAHPGKVELNCCEFAPKASGIRDQHIGLPRFDILRDDGVESGGRAERQDAHLGGRNLVELALALCVECGQVGVAGHEVRPSALDFLPELLERVVAHFVAAPHELANNFDGRISMAVCGNAEPENPHRLPPSF